jgi:hypothetical protein
VGNHGHNDDDEQVSHTDFTQGDLGYVLAVARGILAERYQITFELADALLATRAAAAGLPLVDAAHWLISTDLLP